MAKKSPVRKPASRVTVGSGRDKKAGKQSKLSFLRSRWGLLIAFVVIFGGLGTYLLVLSHAASLNCSPTSLAGHPLVCAQPCPTGTTGNRDAKGYYYCFGQARTTVANCSATSLANTLRCNYGCPAPTTGGLSTDTYFYCVGTPASVALSTCTAVTVSGKAAYRCNGSCPGGYTGNLAGGYYYCFSTTTAGSGTGSARGYAILAAGERQMGKPYVFAGGNTQGATMGGFDCSGLVLYAVYQATGITLPHRSEDQVNHGTPVPYASLQIGDIVFFPGDDGSLGSPDHVGIYAGIMNGQRSVLDAYASGYPVGFHPFSAEHGGFASARRF